MREITYAEAINESIRQNMAKDDSIILMGEDVGVYGGLWEVTKDLLAEFGPDRVIDTPLSEAGFTGAAVGAAMTGLRPIVEIMFIDVITVCMDLVANQAAKMRSMSGGQAKVPMVFRTNIGVQYSMGAQHAQSLHAWFMQVPGLKLALPSTAYDAKGLLNTSLASGDPIMFIEHKALYLTKGFVPTSDYQIPFGVADVKREGSDVTVVATSSMVPLALDVAKEYSRKGVSVEVIDPRTIVPLDRAAIINSVKKTGALVAIDEGHLTGGVASEIVASACEACPSIAVARVAAPDVPIPFSSELTKLCVPNAADLSRAIDGLLEWKAGRAPAGNGVLQQTTVASQVNSSR